MIAIFGDCQRDLFEDSQSQSLALSKISCFRFSSIPCPPSVPYLQRQRYFDPSNLLSMTDGRDKSRGLPILDCGWALCGVTNSGEKAPREEEGLADSDDLFVRCLFAEGQADSLCVH